MSEIDYQPIAERLQTELEQARLEILRLRFSRSYKVDTRAISTFLRDNYLTIAAIGLLLSVLFNCIDFIKSTIKGEKNDA